MRQWMSRVLPMLLLVLGLGMVAPAEASAACRSEGTWVKNPLTQVLEYKVVEKCTGGRRASSTPPAGGKLAPSCDFRAAPPATFCYDSNPCYYKSNVVPYAPPSTRPPTPEADWQVRLCLAQSLPGSSNWQGTAVWMGQANQPPPLIDQARTAFGRLVVPSARLAFNPTARTLVSFDTWFWAQGLTGAELQGSSAFGLVAIATPDRLEVTAGDGSAPLVCPWVTAKSDRCTYAYRHASVGGSARGHHGKPAYQASGRAIWNVRFELNGTPTTIPGAPTVLTSPAITTPVVVDEVQTLVTSGG